MTRYTPVPPQNFGGLPEEHSAYETSRAVIFPVPLERTTTYEHGTRNGPAAIIEASRNMELYDEELELEPYKEIGIHTLPAIDTMDGTLDEVITELFAAQLALLEDEKFPVALGGEHSLTPPLVSAIAKKFKDVSVLQIDAHADQRDEYQANPASHACAMRRVVEVCPAVQVGIRSLCVEEAQAIPHLRTKIYWAKDIIRAPLKSWIAKVLADLSPRVYLTIDLDGFDPSVLPATGTPEPGGLDWYQVTSLIRAVADHKKIVGMDVVELLPQPGDHASNFLAAKLVYKCLGYIFCQS
ncbi:MAG TPA: agmatinase [Candidatus Limnocylindrales bacterium]|nr:agmatinase [Candidatus Limnocylindrales bacterium]